MNFHTVCLYQCWHNENEWRKLLDLILEKSFYNDSCKHKYDNKIIKLIYDQISNSSTSVHLFILYDIAFICNCNFVVFKMSKNKVGAEQLEFNSGLSDCKTYYMILNDAHLYPIVKTNKLLSFKQQLSIKVGTKRKNKNKFRVES